MNCLLIEDDKHTVAMLQQIISDNFPTIEISGNASSIADGISLIKTHQPDFIFLDVNLDDGEGFSILNAFPNPEFNVIFITSYSKYAIEAFKFSALDFILKPFTPFEINDAIYKVIQEHKNQSQLEKLTTFIYNYNSQHKKIVLSDAENIHVIPVENIAFAKSDNSYTIFKLKSNEEIVVTKSLKSFEEKLTPYSFIRIHQKYLININYIDKFHKRNEEIILLDGTILPVSKGKKEVLIKALKDLF